MGTLSVFTPSQLCPRQSISATAFASLESPSKLNSYVQPPVIGATCESAAGWSCSVLAALELPASTATMCAFDISGKHCRLTSPEVINQSAGVLSPMGKYCRSAPLLAPI